MKGAVNLKDVACGGLFILIGLGFAATAWFNLRIGRTSAMGPGYFPIVLGSVLIMLGLVIALGARGKPMDAIGRVPWRGLGLVLGALLVFATTVRSLGVAPSIFIATFMAAASPDKWSWREALVTSICMTAFCVLIFVVALRLPYPVIGPWLGG